MEFDNRNSERKDTLNLLDYVVIDESGEAVDRAIARTLNVSEKGILLETHLALKDGQGLLITIGLENKLFEIEGKVVRCEKCTEGSFSYGVEFLNDNVTEENMAILREFLKAFNKNRK